MAMIAITIIDSIRVNPGARARRQDWARLGTIPGKDRERPQNTSERNRRPPKTDALAVVKKPA